jgi:hypothetical protein
MHVLSQIYFHKGELQYSCHLISFSGILRLLTQAKRCAFCTSWQDGSEAHESTTSGA